MIDKLDLDNGFSTVDWLPYHHGDRSGAKEIQTVVNQLVDAVNSFLVPKKENHRPNMVTDDPFGPHPNIYEQSMAMDKEFAETECVRLQKKLNGITEQLKIAVDALKEIIDWDKCVALRANDFVDIAEKAIQKIQKEAEK